MVTSLGGGSKQWREKVHGGVLWLEENMKNAGEKKGNGRRDGLLWKTKGTYEGRE